MFLNLLNRKEQENFIELATIAMQVDGAVAEEEANIIEVFKREMDIMDYEIKNIPEEKLIVAFNASSKKVKKVVIMEIAGVLDADENVDQSEENWITNIGEQWGFRKSEIKKMLRWVEDFNDLLSEGYEFINKKERL